MCRSYSWNLWPNTHPWSARVDRYDTNLFRLELLFTRAIVSPAMIIILCFATLKSWGPFGHRGCWLTVVLCQVFSITRSRARDWWCPWVHTSNNLRTWTCVVSLAWCVTPGLLLWSTHIKSHTTSLIASCARPFHDQILLRGKSVAWARRGYKRARYEIRCGARPSRSS